MSEIVRVADLPTIKMSNKLAEAKYRLGINEQKLFMYAVELIDPAAEEFDMITFNLKDYSKRSGMNLKELYRDIQKIVVNLMETVLVIQDEDDKLKWKTYNLTSHCDYDNGKITIEFNRYMKPFLLNLKSNYFSYLGDIPMQFKSWNSIRIYQFLKANAFRMGHADGIKIEYMELRAMLGIGEKEYDRFDNFRARVLDVAKKEINNKSDIRFEYGKILDGKKIVGIKFEVDLLPTAAAQKSKEIETIMGEAEIKKIKKQCGLSKERFTAAQVMELYEMAVGIYEKDPYKYVKMSYEYMKAKVVPKRGIFACLRDVVKNDRGSAAAQIEFGYDVWTDKVM